MIGKQLTRKGLKQAQPKEKEKLKRESKKGRMVKIGPLCPVLTSAIHNRSLIFISLGSSFWSLLVTQAAAGL